MSEYTVEFSALYFLAVQQREPQTPLYTQLGVMYHLHCCCFLFISWLDLLFLPQWFNDKLYIDQKYSNTVANTEDSVGGHQQVLFGLLVYRLVPSMFVSVCVFNYSMCVCLCVCGAFLWVTFVSLEKMCWHVSIPWTNSSNYSIT